MDPRAIDILKKEVQPVREFTIGETTEYAKNLIKKNKQVRLDVAEKVCCRKLEHYDTRAQILDRTWKNGLYAIEKRISAIQCLQAALDEHRRADEVVIQIKSSFHWLQNGRNSLAEEKRILREIKCAQEHKEKICLDFDPEKWWMHQDLREIVESKKMIKEHKELLFQELQALRKLEKEHNSKAIQLKKLLEVVERDIYSLQFEMRRSTKTKRNTKFYFG